MRVTKRQLRSIIREAAGLNQTLRQNLRFERDAYGQVADLGEVPEELGRLLYVLEVFEDEADVAEFTRRAPGELTPEAVGMLKDLAAATARLDDDDIIRWSSLRGYYGDVRPYGYDVGAWAVRELADLM